MKKLAFGWCSLVLLLVSVQLPAQAPSTRSTEFWGCFLENLDLMSNGAPKFSFLISSEYNASGTIEFPVTGFSMPFTVTAGTVNEVFLPAGIFYPIGSEFVDNMGFRITSDQPVSVSMHHHRLYFSEASILLPLNQLGDAYLVMAHSDDGPSGLGMSSLIVEATEDNTIIDITPSALTRGLRPPGVTFSVTLNKGNVYQVQSYGDLTGSSVKARDGKKIAVFGGARQANVTCYYADDHLFDQQYPLRLWGNEYMALPFSNDQVRILASEDGTQVYLNCAAPITLDKGEHYDVLLAAPTRISASAPIAVGQFKRSQDCSSLGDPTFLQLAPMNLYSKKAVFSSLISAINGNAFTVHYVNILVQTANASLLTLDNNAVSFSQVPQNPSYSYAKVLIAPGPHTLVSDSGFYALAYGFKDYDAYSYLRGYDGMRSGSSALSITAPSELCTNSELAFTASATFTPAAWNWNFGNGATSNVQNPTYTYASPGVYPVTLLVTDNNGCPVVAQETVSVELCAGAECDIFVPSAFSPNDDGTNDLLCVYGSCIAEMDFTIYDRWGEVIFHTTDPAVCWNGSKDGEYLSNAVFAYVLKATRQSGSQVTMSGNITLIR